MFHFSKRSLQNLEGVHDDLQQVAKRALELTQVDFVIIQGLRTPKEQQKNLRKGVSWTMNSRHLTGHAIDVAPYVNGAIDYQNLNNYMLIRNAFFQAAKELGIPLRWGGDWNCNGDYHDEIKRGVYDGGHFELPRKDYPVRAAKQLASSKRVGFASIGTVATLGVATDTLHEFAGFKAALNSLFGDISEWFWLALILIAFAGVIWTKWHDGD